MIETKFLNNNNCYTKPTKIKPQYIIVHSTACGYRDKDQLYNNWNKPDKLSVHGMVDDTGSWQTLPLNFLGWHVGSRGNSKTVGFEICEPKNIVYANANHTKVDAARYNPKNQEVKADFEKRYKNAVELATYFCRKTGLGADKILSHKEACAKGIASNHGDVEHWFPLFGKNMDGFREDVKKELAKKPNPNCGGDFFRVIDAKTKRQLGAFRDIDNALNKIREQLLNGKDVNITC